MIASPSAYEIQLVTDPGVMLAKNKIIRDVSEMFGKLAEDYKKEILNLPTYGHNGKNAKISKGENYKGLPYVILDFPRIFLKDDVFAIRSFFWWGHFFSITLHLEGNYQKIYSSSIKYAIQQKQLDDWYISGDQNRWEHHFDDGNYVAIQDWKKVEIDDLPFLKLAKKIPLIKWDNASSFFIENFSFLIKLLYHQAPIL